ncbi:uncharacterized protein [Anoplolepis gracilipes]|uniref:uncharacterized protein n=1 Tax=Anoplolepis gracilipes TaxID=354296 RepID=UPI003BA23E46
MAINIKFTKFNNTAWGFRLAGGSDFPQPLTVIRITEGSLAECMGLKVGDVVVRLNDQPISNLTHGQAHEAIVHAGNNFVLAVQREEEARKAVEAISEENIVPYKIALADLPPVFPEQILKEETVIERYEEEKTVVESLSAEEEVKREEEKLAEEKPVDANSELVPNKNLTDDEIAQLILEEEELLSDKGLLGVNFKKLRPRAPILKESRVLEELQHIATAEPERTQELKRTSTFLQKPQRPIPKSKQKVEEDDAESYKVVIKKQDKKTVIARLVEKGLLPPGSEASIAGTPEPPEPSEVKMHETKNQHEEDRPPVVSHLNPSCLISPLDNINDSLSPSRSPQLDSNETCPSEDQLGSPATYNSKSKLFDVKPNHYRRYSSADRYKVRRRSSFKGHYLENVLCGYAHSCVSRDRQLDSQFEFAEKLGSSKKYWLRNIDFDYFTSSETTCRRRMSRCSRAHYAERILLRNVNAITRHFRSKPKTSRIITSRTKRTRTKGRYLATYLKRESIRLVSLMTTLFQFLLQRSSISESSNISEIRKRRLSVKGCYLKHILQKNVITVLQRAKKTHLIDDYPNLIKEKKDEPKSTRTKGHYMEKCLYRQNLYLKSVFANLFGSAKNSFNNLFTITSSSRIKRAMRGRYFEQFIRRNLEILELFTEYVCIKLSEWLEESPSCISQKEFSVVTSNYIADNSVQDENMDEDVCDIKISGWHEDGPSCSLQKESIVTFDNLDKEEPEPSNKEKTDESEEPDSSNKEKIDENDVRNDNSILPEEVDELSVSSKIPETEDTFSKILQSTENYISTEVFHRGSRRLSKSRKSIDIIPEQDDNTLSKFMQSTENYISTEVFHRGSRRLSKSRKSVDIISEQDDNTLSKFMQSTENYISTEVFHRGSRRLSKSRKSVDIIPEQDDDTVSKFLQSAENYISTEVFHRGSRRLSRSSKDMEQETGVLSNLLHSTGNYVSSEVFHRRSRRLSKSSRRESISFMTPDSESMYFNLPWFSLRVTDKSIEHQGDCKEKIDSEIERDNRRLSFVPTILYQSITNRIGVDFTRLVAYAFVPCTSIILLYMYNYNMCSNFIIIKTITPETTPTLTCRTEQEERLESRSASKVKEEEKSDEADEFKTEEKTESKEENYRSESRAAGSSQDETTALEEESSGSTDQAATKVDSEKVKELVSTEFNLEQQLENVQRQLLALKQLPNEIESHLKIVSEQLQKIMELSGMQRSLGNGSNDHHRSSEENIVQRKDEEKLKEQEEDTDEEDEEFTETYDYIEEIACLERKTSSRSTPQVMIEPSDDEGEMEEEEAEMKELDGTISVKSADEEGSRVKKFIVSYETKLLKTPSPVPSHGSFEPDSKLSPKDQVIQELQQRMQNKGKKQSQDLWPQAKQLELTQGRRWRCPNDFFNDEMIAEVLSCQAEVIRGKIMGVNFKKYEKTNLPNYDYLMNSSVYKMIHKMEREPKKGIPVRPAKVNAAEDIIERVKSPALSVIDDRSTRSVSH